MQWLYDFISDSELELIRKGLGVPDLNIHISQYDELLPARPWMKAHLDKHLIKDPKLIGHSVSHTLNNGGFVMTALTKDIGFDIEVTSRIKEEIVARVSGEDELEGLDKKYFYLLWPAKESAFKSCRTLKQPSLISEIFTHEWKQVAEHVWNFKFSPHLGTGVVLERDRLILGFSTLHSTLVQVDR